MQSKTSKNILMHLIYQKENWKKFSLDIESIDLRQKLDTLGLYIPFFNKAETTILDFSNNKDIYMIDVHRMKVNDENIKDDLKNI